MKELEGYAVPIDQEPCFGSKEFTVASMWIQSVEKMTFCWCGITFPSTFVCLKSRKHPESNLRNQISSSGPILKCKLSSMNKCFGSTFCGYWHHVRLVVKYETCTWCVTKGGVTLASKIKEIYIYINIKICANVASHSCQILLVPTQEIFLV
jgi:hypothetical protein